MDDTTKLPPTPPGMTEQKIDDVNFEMREDAEPDTAEPVINPFEQTLSWPIQAHGEELRILKWKEPTARDIEEAGNPISVDLMTGERPTVTFNEKKMSAMISQLCKIPPSSVKQLSAGDWHGIAWKLVRFFMPRMVG
jgi:hypothetical protein